MHYINILYELRHLATLSSHHKRLQEAQYVADSHDRQLDEHDRIFKTCFENGSSIHATHRSLRVFYDPHRRSYEQAIRRIIDKFCTTNSLKDTIQPTRTRCVPMHFENMEHTFSLKIWRTLILMRCGFNRMAQPAIQRMLPSTC